MKILSGTSNIKLSKDICKKLRLRLVNTNIKRLTLVLHFQLEGPPSIGGRKRYLERISIQFGKQPKPL